jgi:putative Holliday junction resolvase
MGDCPRKGRAQAGTAMSDGAGGASGGSQRQQPPGRVIALDVGAKRIGVAACDPDRIVTRTAGVVRGEPVADAIAAIGRIVRDEEAVLVVVGWPLTLRGEVGPQAQRIEAFVEDLRAALPVPIVLYDERLTSSVAQRLLEEERPVSREERRKGAIDQLAARLLLDDYLQEQRLAATRIDYTTQARPDAGT